MGRYFPQIVRSVYSEQDWSIGIFVGSLIGPLKVAFNWIIKRFLG